MRASVLALGPLLARFGKAKVSLPGGCAIGTRPIDLHLVAFRKLGAEVRLEAGNVIARAPQGGRLIGGEIHFDKVTVTGNGKRDDGGNARARPDRAAKRGV